MCLNGLRELRAWVCLRVWEAESVSALCFESCTRIFVCWPASRAESVSALVGLFRELHVHLDLFACIERCA